MEHPVLGRPYQFAIACSFKPRPHWNARLWVYHEALERSLRILDFSLKYGPWEDHGNLPIVRIFHNGGVLGGVFITRLIQLYTNVRNGISVPTRRKHLIIGPFGFLILLLLKWPRSCRTPRLWSKRNSSCTTYYISLMLFIEHLNTDSRSYCKIHQFTKSQKKDDDATKVQIEWQT